MKGQRGYSSSEERRATFEQQGAKARAVDEVVAEDIGGLHKIIASVGTGDFADQIKIHSLVVSISRNRRGDSYRIAFVKIIRIESREIQSARARVDGPFDNLSLSVN